MPSVTSSLPKRTHSDLENNDGDNNDDYADKDVKTRTRRRINRTTRSVSSPSKTIESRVQTQAAKSSKSKPKPRPKSRPKSRHKPRPKPKPMPKSNSDSNSDSDSKPKSSDKNDKGKSKEDAIENCAKVLKKRTTSKKRNTYYPTMIIDKTKTTIKPTIQTKLTAFSPTKITCGKKKLDEHEQEQEQEHEQEQEQEQEQKQKQKQKQKRRTIGMRRVLKKQRKMRQTKVNVGYSKKDNRNEDDNYEIEEEDSQVDDEQLSIHLKKKAKKKTRKDSTAIREHATTQSHQTSTQRQVPKSSKRKRKRRSSNLPPHPPLTPGDQFVTIYGVVQVISDNRIPSDYGTTRIEDNIKLLTRQYHNRKKRLQEIKKKTMVYVALVQMQRRNRLIRLNDHYRSERNNGKVLDHEEQDTKLAVDIWAVYCTCTTPKDVLTGFSAQQIWQRQGLIGRPPPTWNGAECNPFPNVKKKNVHSWDPGTNPMVPKDSFPDRIVECILIPDSRPKCWRKEVKDPKKECFEQVLAAESIDTTRLEQSKAKGEEYGMKLYIRRQTLTQVYDPLESIYTCSLCGKKFKTWEQLRAHLLTNICRKKSERVLRERRDRLEEVEEAIITANTRIFSPPQKAPPKKKPLKPGEKKPPKRKRGKKYPSWIIFYPDTSPIYPEVYEHVGFRRGSNNTKFMKRKWDKIGLGRKRMEKKKNRFKQNNNTVYPQVWSFLFGGLSSAERRIELYDAAQKSSAVTKPKTPSPKRNTAKKLVQDKDKPSTDMKLDDSHDKPSTDMKLDDSESAFSPDTPILPLQPPTSEELTLPPVRLMDDTLLPPSTEGANKESVSTVVVPLIKKRKRLLSPIANPKPPVCRNIVVDIRPLVEEIRGGRYPSMKPYVGHHPDVCFLCKTDKDNVYFCEFCSNSEHLECVQSKVNVRDPEPDDEFMCHRCVMSVLSRRNRAEKRRLQKLDDSLGLTTDTIVGSGDGIGIATIVSTATNPTLKTKATVKREVVWSQSDFDCHRVSYGKCPIGGPGGLICCRSCSTAYSRFLVNTSREMEGQTVSKGGQDVHELMELLLDAQVRLKQCVDVTNANNVRRALLDRDEIEHLSRDNNMSKAKI